MVEPPATGASSGIVLRTDNLVLRRSRVHATRSSAHHTQRLRQPTCHGLAATHLPHHHNGRFVRVEREHTMQMKPLNFRFVQPRTVQPLAWQCVQLYTTPPHGVPLLGRPFDPAHAIVGLLGLNAQDIDHAASTPSRESLSPQGAWVSFVVAPIGVLIGPTFENEPMWLGRQTHAEIVYGARGRVREPWLCALTLREEGAQQALFAARLAVPPQTSSKETRAQRHRSRRSPSPPPRDRPRVPPQTP